MSLLYYRQPDHRGRTKSSLAESECASYLRRAEAVKSRIPESLQFAEIVKNNPLPPCSLNDFMDYLTYVEYNAECLQFFLWFCDYVERWTQLPKEQRELSPMWDASKSKKSTNPNGLNGQAARMNRIFEILETKHDEESENPRPLPQERVEWPLPLPAASLTKTQRAAAQPYRDEVTRIVGHYISKNGPRQLNLEAAERISCILAVKQTTHPSALLPAFAAAEALLRGESHPNFIRWTICNSNRPRVIFVRIAAVLSIFLGFAFVAALVLSHLSRYLRVAALPLWLIGFTSLLASRHGISLTLHWNNKRDLRPWEQPSDDEFSVEDDAQLTAGIRKLQRSETDDTVCYRLDPLRKPGLQSLGPGNDFDTEPWVEQYRCKSVWRKIFEGSTVTQNKHVRRMQDRAVMWAWIWAGLLSAGLAAGSVFIPAFPLY